MAEVPDQAQRDVSAQGQSFRLLSLLPRLLPIFAALWLGVLITIGLLVAPTLFAHLPRAEAGRIAGLLFGVEARFSVLASWMTQLPHPSIRGRLPGFLTSWLPGRSRWPGSRCWRRGS